MNRFRMNQKYGCLRMERGVARRLMQAAEAYPAGDDLRRLLGYSGLICALAEEMRGVCVRRLPTEKGIVRILHLARDIVAGGEWRPDSEELLRKIAEWDDIHGLEMAELMHMPTALRIALCESLAACMDDVRQRARVRRMAERWMRGGYVPGRAMDACFWAHAMRMAGEREDGELKNRIEAALRREKKRPEWMMEQENSISAQLCMRMDNLMALRRMLVGLDWQACFEKLSVVDAELREDETYAGMDDDSRAAVRGEAAYLARRFGMSEQMLVRHGLRMAENSGKSVCHYLYADAGRTELRNALDMKAGLRAMVPDPKGRRTAGLVSLSVLAMALVYLWAVESPVLWIYALPLGWCAAMALIAGVYPRMLKPRRMLKMKMAHVPDGARTLVALPVLLSSAKRVEEMLQQMEALGCLEHDGNIDYLLLGDFRDGDTPDADDDAAILSAARQGIDGLNARAQREKYYFLHRRRSLRSRDGRWMGENRKRGALTDLNRLLLGMGAAAFSAENSCAEKLAGRYRYVVTLDADTCYLPGTLQKLIGAMEHPLNRRYGVLQPNMQMMATANENEYTDVVYGSGGVDSYPVSVSDFYQDMCGKGCFAGKGIYNIRAFYDATANRLPDENILSHDLIEGILADAGFLGDVCFYDGCPVNLASDMKRSHRWTRGDWQLLPVMFGSGFSALDRLKMIGNLVRSLYAPALLGLLIHSVWLDAPVGFAVGLLLAYLGAVLHPFDRDGWRRCTLELALLPVHAKNMLDAVVRTLWRLAVSGKHLMDWVPAADAGQEDRRMQVSGRIAAILLAPGLLRTMWIPAVLGLGALFWIGCSWACVLERRAIASGDELTAEQKDILQGIARCTWAFFADCVGENGLPPDNVQMDPPVGAARRTSPTNIGLYMIGCISARRMGFISDDECRRRLDCTMSAMEGMEKWHGHLFNWYDTEGIEPLRPRYVSAVDSGNLAAALLLCAKMSNDDVLSGRMRAMAGQMDLAALYDAERKLFRIGADVENGRLSQSHYDLYASESRILSFAAMMLEQVKTEHWKYLARPSVRLGKDAALASWSGTMFEYLMPELLMRSHPRSMAGRSAAAVTAWQRRYGRLRGRPWGISESGHYAFDVHLNYQYRAFGMVDAALNDDVSQEVVAPYASALALCVHPRAAAENLRRMMELGWMEEHGLYEAADYLRPETRLVKSHMAHHQGMILCAICNALCGDYLCRGFMEIPSARALQLLLQEKAVRPGRMRRRVRRKMAHAAPEPGLGRAAEKGNAADMHLLHGGGTTVMLRPDGAMFAWRGRMLMNRLPGDILDRHAGMFVHVENMDTNEKCVLGGEGVMKYDIGSAHYRREWGKLKMEMDTVVSPEDGSVFRRVRLRNDGETELRLRIAGCFAVALADRRDMRAHAAFQNLFVESNMADERTLEFIRRPRSAEAPELRMYFTACGDGEWSCESDMERLTGRRGSLGAAGGISDAFSGTSGHVINPCGAIGLNMSLNGGQEKAMHFVLSCDGTRLDTCRKVSAVDRALQLADTHGRAILRQTGIDGRMQRTLQRASAFLMDGKLRIAHLRSGSMDKKRLWSAGISGDLPILMMEIADADHLQSARQMLHIHAYYRMMGIENDLVLVNCQGNDYHQPVHSGLMDMVSAGYFCGDANVPGGVYVIDEQNMNTETMEALRRMAVVYAAAGEEPIACFRRLRFETDLVAGAYKPMDRVEMAVNGWKFSNGYGGFDRDGAYAMLVRHDHMPPAPWSNMMASDGFGALMTDRGGGFAWYGNSRSGRITPFGNDILKEGWGWMLYLVDDVRKRYVRLLPGDVPMTDYLVRFMPGRCIYSGAADDVEFSSEFAVSAEGLHMRIRIQNRGERDVQLRLACRADWLMGTDETDKYALRAWRRHGACFASGCMDGVGLLACDDGDAEGNGSILYTRICLNAGESCERRMMLGWAVDVHAAEILSGRFQRGRISMPEGDDFRKMLSKLQIETPDDAVNRMANGFLQAQILYGRILGRTGLYQPGGAYGFRDQLQDMLAMIHYDPDRVHRHILHCAGRQFADGDVMHWWHEPYSGVRTKISDDLLFLPYVTARYVQITGDAAILDKQAAFLENMDIPEGKEDIYAEMRPSGEQGSLHEHCMRAFRRAYRTGEHGLCLMGSGDWNDGMNRVGAHGRGESIWLSEFIAVCAAEYAKIAPDEADRAWLLALNERICTAVEQHGWDGQWYLRAYMDDGSVLGSRDNHECRIDAVSQAWSVFAGLDSQRTKAAMHAAWDQLVDERHDTIRLLTPPFDGKGSDPGYIAAYPPGIRENGAQYTHAACWMACALAKMNDLRAHEALRMLVPVYHADAKEKADVYQVEPYVMAADIYSDDAHAGRGGWTWYTGSASWMLMAILEILGFERRGERVRMNALLGDWSSAAVVLRFGSSTYRLVCRGDARAVTLDGLVMDGDFIEMRDDGETHTAVFPARTNMLNCTVEQRKTGKI